MYLRIGYIVGLEENIYKDKFINDTLSIFNVNPSTEYIYYRIFIINAEGETPGLSYWHLYSVDPIII